MISYSQIVVTFFLTRKKHIHPILTNMDRERLTHFRAGFVQFVELIKTIVRKYLSSKKDNESVVINVRRCQRKLATFSNKTDFIYERDWCMYSSKQDFVPLEAFKLMVCL